MGNERKRQKEYFNCALQKRFNVVDKEKKIRNPQYYEEIHQLLLNNAESRKADLCKINSIKNCGGYDYFIPSKNMIIEYDEEQHFTLERKLALESYPVGIILNFSKSEWIKHCEKIQAKHKRHTSRDEQRAYYDTVRDLEAIKSGYKLIRIKHGDFDWINSSQNEIDNELKRLSIL